LSDTNLIVGWSEWSSLSGHGLLVVSSWETVSGDGLSVKLGDVTNATTSSDETLSTVVSWSLLGVSVSVTLTASDIEGEHIILIVIDSLIEDIVIEGGSISGNLDSLEPVDSHSLKNIINWLSLSDSSLEDSEHLILLSVESLNSISFIGVHSLCEISESIGGILSGRGSGLVHILELFVEHIELEIEWSLNLQQVVIVDVLKSVSSLLKNSIDVQNSGSLGSSNGSSDLASDSSLISCSESSTSSTIPILVINSLDSVVTVYVVMDIVSSVGSTWLWVAESSVLLIPILVAHVLSMGVSVQVIVTHVVAISVLASKGSVWISLTDSTSGTTSRDSRSKQ